MRAQGQGVRAIARQPDRPPCTISRELRRNAATRGGALDYRATTAQWHADRSARRPKPAKLAINPFLPDYVQDRLAGTIASPDGAPLVGPKVVWKGRRAVHQNRRWATHGARNRLLAAFASTSPRMRRCASVMRRSIRHFMCKVEELCAAKLTACLRTGRVLRMPRARASRQGRNFISPEIMISQRPAGGRSLLAGKADLAELLHRKFD